MQPETRYAKRGDIHIAYQVYGRGDVDVIVVSDWFSHLESRWDIPDVGQFHRRLGSFARVIAFDKYGIGLSDPVPSQTLPPLEEWMDDVQAVMDAVDSPRAAIIGANSGGMMAALFAATYPERTSALVLGNTAARLSAAADYEIGIPLDGQAALLAMVEAGWGTAAFAAALMPSIEDEPVRLESWSRFLRGAASPATATAVLRTLFELDVRHVLAAIRVPTLILHRVDNPIITFENARYMAARIEGARLVELAGSDYSLVTDDVDRVSDEIEEFLTGTPVKLDADRVLATVLFTDIVGSTERLVEVGDTRWKDLLQAHDELAQRQLPRYGGKLIESAGDSLLATFDGPARAIRCALAIRDDLRTLGIDVRAGLHTGEIEHRGNKIRGIGVHVAARVQGLAGAGEVLVSRTVKDLVAGSRITFSSRGMHRLKGVPDEWEIFAVDG